MPVAPNQPIHAYVVTLVYGPGAGPIHVGTAFAANQQEATAMVSDTFWRERDALRTFGPLCGVAVIELPAEWLRAALNAVEIGKPAGDILTLVRPAAEDDGPDPAAA